MSGFQTGEELGIAYSDPKTGEYSITLPAGEAYGFLAQSKGFLSEAQNLDIKELETYQEIEQDLFLIPAKKGETVVLKNIFFAASSAELNSESKNELKRIFNFLRMNPTVKGARWGTYQQCVQRAGLCATFYRPGKVHR